MARPTLITVELIQEITEKFKRKKEYIASRVEVAKRPDGQSVYWYKTSYREIWKALSKRIDIEYESLLSAKRKRPEIANALKNFGQYRPEKFGKIKSDNIIKPGTNAYFIEKIKRQAEENQKLKKQLNKNRQFLVSAKKQNIAQEEMLAQLENLTKVITDQKKQIKLQESDIIGLKMANASLNAQLALKD